MTEAAFDQTTDYYGEDSATFGDRVAAGRRALGLGHTALSQKLGVHKKTLASWENDLAEPRANKLQMLAGVLNVSMMWLLTGEGEGLQPPDAAPTESEEVKFLILELRSVRGEYKRLDERLGRLEKRLRASL